jgi:hypothetical protein
MKDFIKEYLKDKTKICPKRLNKKIRKVTTITRKPITQKEALLSKMFFDIEGKIIEEKEYCWKKVITWVKYIYSDNELTEVFIGKREWNDGSNTESDFLFSSQAVKRNEKKEVETIDENGQKVFSTYFLKRELASRKIFNKKNICIEVVEYSKKGDIRYRAIYDADGQLLKARRFKSDGTPLNYIVNYFDEQHRLYRSDSFPQTGNPPDVTVLKYDNRGLISETIENPVNSEYAFADEKGGSNGHNYKFFYTTDGLLEMRNHYQGGKHMGSHVFSYEYW